MLLAILFKEVLESKFSFLLIDVVFHSFNTTFKFLFSRPINPRTLSKRCKTLTTRWLQYLIWLSQSECWLWFLKLIYFFNNQSIWNCMDILFHVFDGMKSNTELFTSKLMVSMLNCLSVMLFVLHSFSLEVEMDWVGHCPHIGEDISHSVMLHVWGVHHD